MRITITPRNLKVFTRSRWLKIKRDILLLTKDDQINIYNLTPEDVKSLRATLSTWQKRYFPQGVSIHEKARVTIIQLKMNDPREPRSEVVRKK